MCQQNRDEEKTQPLGVYTCAPRTEKSFTNQVFSLTTDGQIRREETCVAVSDEVKDQVDMTKCLEIENVDPERLAAEIGW